MFIITVEHNLEVVEEFARNIEKQLRNPDLSGEPANRVVKHFKGLVTGGRFAPITEATRRIRASRGQSGKGPLNVSGKLASSIKVIDSRKGQLRVGSSEGKAGFLRFGGVTSSRSSIPGKAVPTRDYLEVTEGLLSGIAQSIFNRLKG